MLPNVVANARIERHSAVIDKASSAINVVGTNVHGDDCVAFDIEHGPKIRFDLCRIYRPTKAGGQSVDFVRAQPRIERTLFENLPDSSRRLFLTGRKCVETFPKTLRRFEAVFHSAARGGGLAPLNTVSMSAKRPASASAMPCLNDSGIQESSFSTTNFATCARSLAGSALNCSINSVALTARIIRP
jgi:hypothetical protein